MDPDFRFRLLSWLPRDLTTAPGIKLASAGRPVCVSPVWPHIKNKHTVATVPGYQIHTLIGLLELNLIAPSLR